MISARSLKLISSPYRTLTKGVENSTPMICLFAMELASNLVIMIDNYCTEDFSVSKLLPYKHHFVMKVVFLLSMKNCLKEFVPLIFHRDPHYIIKFTLQTAHILVYRYNITIPSSSWKTIENDFFISKCSSFSRSSKMFTRFTVKSRATMMNKI